MVETVILQPRSNPPAFPPSAAQQNRTVEDYLYLGRIHKHLNTININAKR
jgi:hypothetical protein